MLELNDKDLQLLKKIEKENCSNYEIIKINCDGVDKFYIFFEKLLVCLEETQNYREYAEMQVKELANVIDGR